MALDPLASIASSRQMAQAAEKIAAAQFARCGFDVSAQDASDRPMYNLVVAKAGVLLKVSVLCSQNGAWSLTQPYLKRASELRGGKTDHQGAIDLWLDHQSSRTVCCLIQFQGVAIDQLPRVYLASPKELAKRLREAVIGLGDSTLYESTLYQACDTFGDEAESSRTPSSEWSFTNRRIEELIAAQDSTPGAKVPASQSAPRVSPAEVDPTVKIQPSSAQWGDRSHAFLRLTA
jgi:hypothetical protein